MAVIRVCRRAPADIGGTLPLGSFEGRFFDQRALPLGNGGCDFFGAALDQSFEAALAPGFHVWQGQQADSGEHVNRGHTAPVGQRCFSGTHNTRFERLFRSVGHFLLSI